MATGTKMPAGLVSCLILFFPLLANAQVLTPPTFNLAQGRKITATATCGVGVANPELFCRLTPTSSNVGSQDQTYIQGQLCDYCIPDDPNKSHKPEYAIDGTEKWWQSPPLSRVGPELNKVNLTLSLGQEFHVAYVFIKMANSPRPGVWVLERSVDFGKTWMPWQYFADTPSDCINLFNTTADLPLTADDQVVCTTKFSKVVPISDGEIVVSIVEDRPNAHNFSYATVLHEWTKATDIQLRFLRTKTLKANLMDVARQDPTTFRRYYYSIKDISIGGRCVCNGHAETCDVRNPGTHKLVCNCVANTCGDKCESCCPGFVQKRWRRARFDRPFECEPCNCHGHSNECIFDEEVERNRQSLDISGNFEGGGVCQNCLDNTEGINCENCVSGFYRPYGVPRNVTDACRPCQCDLRVSTGECEEGSGRCLCREEYTGTDCDMCSDGYYGYPNCVPCDCDVNGTEGSICTVVSGVCPCKLNYAGQRCDQCAPGYYNFPDCVPCECILEGSQGTTVCEPESGQCQCGLNYGSRDCGACAHGFYSFPQCRDCACDERGAEEEICDKQVGTCLCKANYTDSNCGSCESGFFNFPYCEECNCESIGSENEICTQRGQCPCKSNYGGRACDRCAAGYFKYPDCMPCDCNSYGSLAQTCDQMTGQCTCRSNFVGVKCGDCAENFYNYPQCEVCNCNPDGAKEIPGYPLGGCGIVTSGLLCECKDKVQGRICDTCMPGFWNLNRNNPEGCEACGCDRAGTLTDVNRCDLETGQCVCKPYVTGRNCDRCRDGFYDLQEANPFGCRGCNCNPGGSRGTVCDRVTGQCVCKEKVGGLRCNEPLSGYFVPDLHQYKFELEDGRTPEGARVRYGYNDTTFPEFSWRGYAVLSAYQPEVILEVDIRLPSLYQIIYRFVNKKGSLVKGTVSLDPESVTDIVQKGDVNFLSTDQPSFARVSSGGIQAYVLNPGRWTITTKVPDDVYLDYFVLIPQSFYEASQLQEKVTNPCEASGDPGPCIAITYPDLEGFPVGKGGDAYHIVDGQKEDIDLDSDDDLTDELGSSGLALLTQQQKHFLIDLIVPIPDDYILVVNYHNPLKVTQYLEVEINTGDMITSASVDLSSCPYSNLCRQVLRGVNGLEGVYNISGGFAALTFTASKRNEDINVAIDSVIAIPIKEWTSVYTLPKIICIKVNGVCIVSSYGIPVGTILIQFESYPNQGILSIILPPHILDSSVRLVNLNDSTEIVNQTRCQDTVCVDETVVQAVPLELLGTVSKPGDYILIVHYYMPTERGLDIPITLFDDGQAYLGRFQPRFCPNSFGCRLALAFEQPAGRNIRLNGPEIRVLFEGTPGHDIWLDYLLVVPYNQFSPDYLEIEPIDNSQMFITKCVDAGFQLNLTDPYCRQGAFTLTTNFNNGALDCDCNPEGSKSFTCSGDGGNCICKENVIGRKCSACAQGYYGFPSCQRCNCPYGICHEVTGKCICPPNVEGTQCDRCKPGAYGYDPLIGCQLCNCNPYGTVDRNASCDQSTGQCNCKPNVGDRRCDTCLSGYHSYPYCMDCGCDPAGTLEDICDQRTAKCLCKDNVQGQYCDQCADGMFSLTAANPKGCIKCFCFGHTTRCESAGLSWDMVYDMADWKITSLIDDNINTTLAEMDTTLVVNSNDGVLDDEGLFWFAPQSYLGKKLNAYGGKLEYTVMFTLPSEGESAGIVTEDIVLSGSNMTIVHFHNTQPAANLPFKFEVELREYNFRHAQSNAPVSREQFMMLLSHVDSLVIRASYFTRMTQIKLKEVTLQVATEQGQGELAESVEMCLCPSNYMGDSCEVCAPGSYRSRSSTSLDVCIKCNCNGHSDECDIYTGECQNCTDNTMGPNCEQCLPGHYGDPFTGGCNICPCPHPEVGYNFASTCTPAEDGQIEYCYCEAGYTGTHCDSCAPGYYGNPLQRETCKLCDCNGNIDMNNPYSCDRYGGYCQICENDSAGDNCERCKDWFYGDAITLKNCQPCSCDQCGTSVCNNGDGMCECKPNVVGEKCDSCAPNTWGYGYCTGCQDCGCGVGAVSGQCDERTGICECQPGVEGEKCDRCQANHWNIGPSGCQECECLGDGAVGCDSDTGRCQCLPGVTGEKCDRCLPRWVLVAGRGCQECDYCVHLLIDDLDGLANHVSSASRALADVAVGVGAFNKLSYYNDTVEMLRPGVEALQLMDSNELNETLFMLGDKVNNVSQNTMKLQEKSRMLGYEAEELPKNVDTLYDDVNDVYQETDDVAIISNDVVGYIQEVYKGLKNSGSAANLDKYISESEKIIQEMEALDFSPQRNLSQVELQAAEVLKDIVESLKMNATSSLNRTEEIGTEISKLEDRLQDVANSSRHSRIDADHANSIMLRLKAVQMETLSKSLKNVEMMEAERMEFVKNATMLLKEAEDLLAAAESNVMDIESESSRLEAALITLESHVEQTAIDMDGLYEMVNQSQIHADGLATAAAELEQLYESTRNRSQDPVDAGQAYRTIENGIAEARAMANQAVGDADSAKAESENSNSNVTDALMDSEMLLAKAKDLLNQTQNPLQAKLDEDRKGLMEADGKNAEVQNLLTSITEEMGKLNGSSTEPMSTAVMTRNEETLDILKETERLSQSVIDRTADMSDKNSYIASNTPKAQNDKRQVTDSVETVRSSQPEINELVKKVSDDVDRVAKTSKTLGINVDALKEKIAQARDEANRIKVGLSFLGNTSVTLRNPSTLKDTGSYSTASMFFKTSQSDALLMYVGNNLNVADTSKRRKRSITFINDIVEQTMEGDGDDCIECATILTRPKRQAQDPIQRDYLALEIREGLVKFTVNLGSGAAIITSTRKVDDGKWHQIIAQRIGKTAKLTVKSDGEEDDVQDGTTAGTFAVLELNPITTNIQVGGIPADFTLPGDMTTAPYVGQMEELMFDGEPLGLWNFVSAKNNKKGANQRDFLLEVFFEGYRFNGRGYVVLNKRLFRVRGDKTQVELSFKTYTKDGLMFYYGGTLQDGKRDYFAIQLSDGYVAVRVNLGGGHAVVKSEFTYNDGEWHKIIVDRQMKEVKVVIDDPNVLGENLNETTPKKQKTLEATDDIYIGGVDNIFNVDSTVLINGFDGCIKDVKIMREPANLFENVRSKGIVKGCVPKIIHVASFPTGASNSYLGLPHLSIGAELDVTFKMKTEEANALLMIASMVNMTNTFAVYMSEGMIVVTEQGGPETTPKPLESKINTYNDGEWHYISIMKTQQRMTMSIDDTEMVEIESDIGDLEITDFPLYFGGLPFDFTVFSDGVPITDSIAGCMGDITINEKFQNLATVHDRNGITLAECSIDKEEAAVVRPTVTEPDVSDIPDIPASQCALAPVASDVENESAKVAGTRFGSSLYSRYEFMNLPIKSIVIGTQAFGLEFKTTSENGMMFYTAGYHHNDYLALHMIDGKVIFGFDCGTGAGIMKSPKTYNDGQWHKVVFMRSYQAGTLKIDDEVVATGRSRGSTKSLNTYKPYLVGGIPEDEEFQKFSYKNLGAGKVSFHGCLHNLTVNNLPFLKPSAEIDVVPCTDDLESGSFIGKDGGRLQLDDKIFNVGKNLEVMMEIRPRSQEGVLLAVHSTANDFLVLQMFNGSLILSVDNGAGPITLTFESFAPNALCDGNWHYITAVKQGNELDLTVDGVTKKETESGNPQQTSADTNGYLFFGGVEDMSAKGIVTTGDFVGCIRHVRLNNKPQNIAAAIATGDVHQSSCPVH